MRLSELEEKGFTPIDKQLKNFKSKLDKTGQNDFRVIADAGMVCNVLPCTSVLNTLSISCIPKSLDYGPHQSYPRTPQFLKVSLSHPDLFRSQPKLISYQMSYWTKPATNLFFYNFYDIFRNF